MLKTLKYLLITILIFVSATYLYVFREQDIRLDFIPAQFKFCGKVISKGDIDYDALIKLLQNNKNSWVTSFVDHAPKQVYDSPAFRVNILENHIIVSYKTDEGYPQFVKTVKHSLASVCVKYS